MKKIFIFLLAQTIVLTLYSQKTNSVTVSYFNDYYSDNLVEIKTTIFPWKSKIGLNTGVGLNFNGEINAKMGLLLDIYRNRQFNVNIGPRFVYQMFINDDINRKAIAYYYDLLIEIKYEFAPQFFTSIAIMPTLNTYQYDDNKIGLSYSIGVGYSF